MEPLLVGQTALVSLDSAFAYCKVLARRHDENFTVVSWLLPGGVRRHFYSIYAYCRFVDDLGDEAPGDRLALLAQWEAELRRCYQETPEHPIMVALQETIRTLEIPPEPFLRLIEANRIDQGSGRFQSYADLLRYCEHSANPVGHLVLYALGYRDVQRQRLSDATCTALQLANFWQDIGHDAQRNRIYLPLEDMARFGYTEEELFGRVVNDGFRRLIAFQVQRARMLFREGLGLVELMEGRAKLDIALFSLGGMRILDAIERQGYDVFSKRPTLSKGDKVRLMAATALKLLLRRPLD